LMARWLRPSQSVLAAGDYRHQDCHKWQMAG
jgi:hypothetical protein